MTEDILANPTLRLRHTAALQMLSLAMAEADARAEPQCITIVDAGGTVIAQVRMDGARLNALAISVTKAVTAASTFFASGAGGQDLDVALACGGRQTGLEGGVPIYLDGVLVGGIGVSSGPADIDVACAMAAFVLSDRLAPQGKA